ncbi:MAG: hypothetical protein CL910_10860 [Deltaproteobacteria bacterium]|nr:hypothetical protein [Deltaproteobacteria bacterium]
MPLVIAASAVWDTPAPVNAHQVARRFAARGHPVLFVESTGLRAPSLAAPHDLRRIAARLRHFGGGLRELAPGLHGLAPLALPGSRSPAVRWISDRLLAAQVARAVGRLGWQAPLLWAFVPTALPVARAIAPRAVVYHCVDDYAGNPGVDAAWLRGVEGQMLERADLVIASSPVLAERLRERRPEVRCAPNVADVALFGRAVDEALPEPAELAALARPRVLYVGNLAAYRIDPTLLAAARAAAGEGSLVLVGESGLGDTGGAPSELAELLGSPGVAAVGPRPHAELPAWMAHCDVAVIPFLDNEHTRGSLPLKLWEYLAAGLPVVARELPNLQGREELGVRTAADPEGFAGEVRAALTEPPEARAARSAEARRQGGWEERMEELADWTAELLAKGGG